jgi:adenylate kinase family enzyme
MDFPSLETFGRRIMVCGPSNSGKSTLAVALGKAANLPVVHLDQLRFVPHSDWRDRPVEEFASDVAAIASTDAWVIEGNYFTWIAPRLERATGIILLGGSRFANYTRYLRRSLFDTSRAGRLDGGPETINWPMTRWILWKEPQNRERKVNLLRGAGLPLVELASMSELRTLYATWSLPYD